MSGTDTAADVGPRFDVVIDGYGYVFWNGLMQSLPFRNQRAAYSYTPTFLERHNVSGAYGDNEQDFFLTASQDDWSEGSGQLFFRGNDADRARRYYSGVAADPISRPGQVTVRPAVITSNPTGSVIYAMGGKGAAAGATDHLYCSLDTATHTLHTVTSAGVDSSNGAHGAGLPCRWGMCSDGAYEYIAGATKIVSWSGAAFADFSATANAGALAFLNNALYSCDGSTLKVYSTVGAATTLFTWRDAFGVALTPFLQKPKIAAFGGQLLIYWPYMNDGPELWIYDGTSTYRVAKLNHAMVGYDMQIIEGVVYLSGLLSTETGGVLGLIPVVYVYLSGTINELWRSKTAVSGTFGVSSQFLPALGDRAGRLVILDQGAQKVMEYDPSLGAITNIATLTVSGSYASTDLPMVSSGATSILFDYDAGNSSTGNTLGLYPDPSNFATTAKITSSLIDFDNSLTKILRGVKVEWFGAGSVDISHLIDGDPETGSYTTLQTTAVSGTEYLFPAGTTGRTVSVQVTLNNSGGSKPTLTRVYVRAVPVQQGHPWRQYVLDLTGRTDLGQKSNPVQLRDGSSSPLTGAEMATNLKTSIEAGTPVDITDKFGTYSGVFEQGEGITELDEVRPDEYLAQVTARGV